MTSLQTIIKIIIYFVTLVDGEWSHWSAWSTVNERLERTRNCSNPSPQFGGVSCLLKNFSRGLLENEAKSCNGE